MLHRAWHSAHHERTESMTIAAGPLPQSAPTHAAIPFHPITNPTPYTAPPTHPSHPMSPPPGIDNEGLAALAALPGLVSVAATNTCADARGVARLRDASKSVVQIAL